MDVFQLRNNVINDYQNYVESFLHIQDDRIRDFVHDEFEKGVLWPDPLIQLSPSYEMGKTVSEMVDAGDLHPLCKEIFRSEKGESFHLYHHQEQAIRTAIRNEHYILTTGTGSGKSLTYLIPIINHILSHDPDPHQVRALIVYPMNALINSQEKAIHELLNNLVDDRGIIRCARYTGQEDRDTRQSLQKKPPHILLTNYVMLELMMSRPEERVFVDQTLTNLEYFVLDELHTYTGRRGADIAMLIRRIRQRCGNKDLLCIGTSATMVAGGSLGEERKAVAEVATKIFGVQVPENNVIDERLKTSIQYSEEITADTLREAFVKDIPQTYDDFVRNPIAAWIERTFGIESREGALRRKNPITLSKGASTLSEQTGKDENQCLSLIQGYLQAGSGLKHPDGTPVFAVRVHQFISQGDAVYATLESIEERKLTLSGQRFTSEKEGKERFLYPLMFCRECGQEYYQVVLLEDKGRMEPVTSREGEERSGSKRVEGYFLIDNEDDPLWDEERIGELPDNWFRTTQTSRTIESRYRPFLPQRKFVSPDGSVSDEGIGQAVFGWFIRKPLLICPSCGAVYDKRTSEYRKLSRLSSEGRSTATTLLGISTVHQLMYETDVDTEARKLLSFMDNVQDASLQAGHFNDFVKVGLLRNAIYRALPGDGFLDYRNIASTVFEVFDLPPELYARNPGTMGALPRRNREAFTAYLEYAIYRDLRRGWRIIQPNLEQCGLLKIEYDGLKEFCEDANHWQGNEILEQANVGIRYRIIHSLLDHFRRSLAIDAHCLQGQHHDSLKRQVNQTLNEDWKFDDEEKLEEAEWFRWGNSLQGRYSLSAISLIGRYLRSRRTWPFLQERLDTDSYVSLLRSLVELLRDSGYLEIESRNDDFRVRLCVNTIQWWRGNGRPSLSDPLRSKRLQSADDEELQKEVNVFFTDFYKETATRLIYFRCGEHTGQTRKDIREEREQKFGEGKLSCLFCTPTMELGIDIRDLISVNMRNVPPTPANYAQRSGRAGRAGQSAFVTSYCSTYSGHDQYFFQRQPDMVSGVVVPPRMDLSNEELIQSHIQAIWLAFVGMSLKNSVREILDLSQGDLPIHENILHNINMSEDQIRKCIEACRDVLDQCKSELDQANWYMDEWLESTIRAASKRFDEAFDRWRELYLTADKQLKEAHTKLQEQHQLGLNRDEIRRIERLEREARRQKDLLCNDVDSRDDSDFYPYRYLASEGFLPGYNFPRIPVRAYIPSGDRGTYLSRSRFIALSDYGPRNILYHEGQKYRVIRSLLPPADAHSRFYQVKLCKLCGAFHSGDESKCDVCQQCRTALDANSSEYMGHLFEMSTVVTHRWQRIDSNEEERLRKGYEVTTHFRFARKEGEDQRIRAQVLNEEGIPLLELCFGPAADLWRINRRWKKREDEGYRLDLILGIWDKEPEDYDDTALEMGQQNIVNNVYPFVRDTRNIILIKASQNKPLDEKGIINLQHAIHSGMCAEYQIDESEIATERIGKDDERSILFWEAAEGGVGVLQRLVEESDALNRIAKKAMEICHFDWRTGEDLKSPDECARACYLCLLSYRNQWDHNELDRYIAKELLSGLLNSKTLKGHQNLSYEEHYENLRRQTDSRSQLEQDFLDFLYRERRRLPDEAQYELKDYYSRPDFFYHDGFICIFCDGSIHDEPVQKEKDEQIRSKLRQSGFRVVEIRYDRDLREQIKDHQDVFGVVVE